MSAKPIRLPYLNYATFVGRVCVDPELKYTPSETAILELRVAVNKRVKDKTTGDWKDAPYFITVKVWGKTAEYCAPKLHKGSALMASGEMKSDSWETKDGEKRTRTYLNAFQCQCLDMADAAPPESAPTGDHKEEPDAPKDQLDDIPF